MHGLETSPEAGSDPTRASPPQRTFQRFGKGAYLEDLHLDLGLSTPASALSLNTSNLIANVNANENTDENPNPSARGSGSSHAIVRENVGAAASSVLSSPDVCESVGAFADGGEGSCGGVGRDGPSRRFLRSRLRFGSEAGIAFGFGDDGCDLVFAREGARRAISRLLGDTRTLRELATLQCSSFADYIRDLRLSASLRRRKLRYKQRERAMRHYHPSSTFSSPAASP